MSELHCDIAIIGGGAAGFFAAIHAAESGKNVIILEKTQKLLSKVKVSGGGRCNVTHNIDYAAQLINHYPRGGKSLRKAFEIFGVSETKEWFEKRGVPLKVEDDGRIFPKSDNSESIINCLLKESKKRKVQIKTGAEVISINQNEGFELALKSGDIYRSQKVIVTSGGYNKIMSYKWLEDFGVKIANPIPSLFTFNVPDSDLKDLKGLSVKSGWVQIPGSKWKMEGPILITHWGFSAPAVIKLSAWAAIDLYNRNYSFPILINWCGLQEEEVREEIQNFKITNPKKSISANRLFDLPSRLWEKLSLKAGIDSDQQYHDLSKKQANKLVEMIIRTPYEVNGKTTFKEEFVTCGGVELDQVDLTTFESKKIPGLYFAGEVLNVDGITGGFNFQHAWTSGYLAGKHSGG